MFNWDSIKEWGKSARGELGQGETHESPTPNGVRLTHVFVSLGIMSESGRGPKALGAWGQRVTVGPVGEGGPARGGARTPLTSAVRARRYASMRSRTGGGLGEGSVP